MMFVCLQKDPIICPRLTALCAFGVNCLIFFWYLQFINVYSMFVGLIGSFPSAVIYFLLSYTFPKKKYNLYKYAIFISIIYAFVFTILRIIGINIVSKLNAGEDEDEDDIHQIHIKWIKISAYIFYTLGIILDLLLVGIIFCYKKKVQNILESKLNDRILPEEQILENINMNNVA